MADLVEKRTRGLIAIAITDGIHALGLRPISALLVSLRGFFRVTLPTSTGEAVKQVVFARRSTAMSIGCVGILGISILPILLLIEAVRAARVRRHNQAMRRLLEIGSPAPSAGYRNNLASPGTLREQLLQADTVLAIDWTMWRDGAVCLAGSALGIVRGNEHLAPWTTVYRGPPPRDAIDAKALTQTFADLPLTLLRCEWEQHDPFEAVERN